MTTYNSSSTNASNIDWFNSITIFAAGINIAGSMAAISNADGSWTVLHGDVFGFSLSPSGQLSGTIRWITHTNNGGAGFIVSEFEAVGGVFDHLNLDAATFQQANLQAKYDMVFNRSMVLNGDSGDNLLGGGTFGDAFNGGDGTDTASYEKNSGIVEVDLAGFVNFTGAAAGDSFNSIENLTGTNTDTLLIGDSLFGNSGNNVLRGLGGNDFLNGREGDDTLEGGNGNDEFFGGTGIDTMDGGDGSDTLNYSNAVVSLYVSLNAGGGALITDANIGNDLYSNMENIISGSGNDTLGGDVSNNNIKGNAGSDTIYGGGGDDVLEGGEDNDYIGGGSGNNTVHGGNGTDTLTFVDTGAIGTFFMAEGGNGSHTFTGGSVQYTSIENVEGSAFTEQILGNSGNNTLGGLGGEDYLGGGQGVDVLLGGDGNDILQGGAGDDTLYGGTTAGDSGSDTMTFSDDESGVGLFFTLGALGNGVVETWGVGTDTYFGIENVNGTGSADNITGNAEANVFYGNDGNDTLDGGNGNDTLQGGGGADTLKDGGTFISDDVFEGGDGDDTFAGNSGSDSYDGGAGVDTLTFASLDFPNGTSAGRVEVDLLFGNVYTFSYDQEGNEQQEAIQTILNASTMENVTGTNNGDFLGGNSAANILRGGRGNDGLSGFNGNDTLDGGLGADEMRGGKANDTYVVDDAGDTVIEGANEGTDTVLTTLNVFTLSDNVERASFEGSGNFNVTGNDMDNILTGGTGNDLFRSSGVGQDTFNGGTGTDTVAYTTATIINLDTGLHGGAAASDKFTSIERFNGSSFSDTMVGMSGRRGAVQFNGLGGSDTLTGGAGSDTLAGGAAGDTLTGGLGKDKFVYRQDSESTGNTVATRDTITDFNANNSDVLDLEALFSGVLTFVGTGAFTGANQVRYVAGGANTIVQINLDADIAADMSILLTGIHTLDVADFVL